MAGDGGLRHVVKRRVHLERSQPDNRKRLGLLEKHKDYVLRARDYHKKEKALKALREKALLRNPDEFYFKMTRSKLDDKGRFVPLETNNPSFDQKKRMNVQNANLVTLKSSVILKKFLRAEQRLHHVGASQASHKFFGDDEEETEDTVNVDVLSSRKRTSEVEEMNRDDSDSDLERISASLLEPTVSLGAELLPHNRRKVTPEKVDKAAKTALNLMESIVSEYENLAASKKRVGKLHRALELIDLQKNLMPAKKGAPPPHVRKVKGSDGERVCHRWEARRKR